MQKNRKNIFMMIAVIAVVIIVFLIIHWLKPEDVRNDISSNTMTNTPHQISNQAEESHSLSQLTPFVTASQKDTEVNCKINLSTDQKLIVDSHVRDCFEYFLSQYGEKPIDQIHQDFLSYIKQGYKEPVLSQLSDLWSRYLKYREGVADLPVSASRAETAKDFKAAFNQLQNLRKKYFSSYEIEGLFGVEDTYHQYTLNRLAIFDDQSLNEAEKAKQLSELFNQLPKDWQENIQQVTMLENLHKLTDEIKKRGGSAAEIRQMRTNLVGAEATQRLENLDQQRSDWKTRVNQYLEQRDSIQKSGMSDPAKQQAIDQMRQQSFNSPQEQLRINTFESIHDKGGVLPFNAE